MTTEAQQSNPRTGGPVLVKVSAAALVLGLCTVLAGALLRGAPAAWGALIGTAIILGVFGAGALAVDLVSRAMPSISLLVALMTYLLQVLMMGLVFLVLSRSGALDDAVDARWLAGVVIAGTLAWLVAQIVLTTRLRLPAYDLRDAGAR